MKKRHPTPSKLTRQKRAEVRAARRPQRLTSADLRSSPRLCLPDHCLVFTFTDESVSRARSLS
jgi:hypothetical protein